MSLSTQLVNILNNFQMNNSFQNILEMKNIGYQIYNIGFNIQKIMNPNMGMNMMNMPNPINQNLIMNMNMNNLMNPFKEMSNFNQCIVNNNNEERIEKINCEFNLSGETINVICDITETIEEMLKKYLMKKNLNFMVFENEIYRFLFGGGKIKKDDLNKKLKDFFIPLRVNVTIIVCKTREVL